VYVSVADTLVQVKVADEAFEPAEAADQETNLRVVSEAAFDVPSSPGSPRWILM
jgi:phosphoribosyl-ATP pyrophosphohydrolase